MNLMTISFLCVTVLSIGCSDLPDETQNSPENSIEATPSYPFNTQIMLKEVGDNVYDLIVQMDLEEGSYFGSPHSNNSFKGLFDIEVEANEHFVLEDSLYESPESSPEYDHLSKEYVNWVRESTTYTQRLTLNETIDFSVDGVVSFVIEPMCNRFEVAFEIQYFKNQLSVIKGDTKIANL